MLILSALASSAIVPPAVLAAPGPGAAAIADKSPAAAAETSQVKPAAERTIAAGVNARPSGSGRGGSGASGPGSRPGMRGTQIPEALRARMKAQLDARIEGDLKQIRDLRGEAVGLLTMFVQESPREAQEMPEAMMRLGELKWEAERDGFVDRFRAWESRPVDQRGPAPEG